VAEGPAQRCLPTYRVTGKVESPSDESLKDDAVTDSKTGPSPQGLFLFPSPACGGG